MRVLVVLLVTVLSLLTGLAPAQARDPVPVLTLTSAPAHADDGSAVSLHASDSVGNALGGLPVGIERLVGDTWIQVAVVTSDEYGAAAFGVQVARVPEENRLRAVFAGDGSWPAVVSAEHRLTLVPRQSRLRLRGPGRVVDEQSIDLTLEWVTDTGVPVEGPVGLERRLVQRPGERSRQEARGRWRVHQRLRTGADGTVTVTVAPRATFRWRVVAAGQAWAEGGRSAPRTVRNLPPVRPARLPAGAPRPRIVLPPQQRAVGAGAHPVVGEIPPWVWARMRGRSWHRGCPVGRSGLRLVQVNYWDYDGYRRRGELVVNASVARNFTGAFVELYERRLPIRSMYRVDRFGWSGRLNGADDYASMAAGNTSVFNCRSVVNNPGVRSPHSWGRAVDINTWENPYRSRAGIVPNSWWQFHQHARYAWRSSSHQVVSLMRRHGFRWTFGLGDTQHFDAIGGESPRLAALLRGDPCVGICK